MGEVHNLLHTWANHYLNSFTLDLPSRPSKIDDDIIHLSNLESNFYRKFGANTYEEFISKIREIYNGNDADRKCIERFTNTGIRPFLLNMEGQKNISGSTIEVEIVMDQTELKNAQERINKNMNLTAKAKGNKIQSSVNTKAYRATFDFDRESFLQFVYEAHGTRAQRGKKTYNTIENDLNNLLSPAIAKSIKIKIDGIEYDKNPIEMFKYSFQRDARSYPWGYSKAELEAAQKNPDEQQKLYNDISLAWDLIYDFVFKTLLQGCSETLRQSAEATWTKIMGNPNDPNKILTNMSFFSSGGGKGYFVNAVVGAFGEFQYDMILEYTKRRLGVLGLSSEVVGNITGQKNDPRGISFGEKGKTDVEMIADQQRLGVQIKNYNYYNTVDTIGTTIHPDKFADLADLQGNYRDSFLTFLANYYFNITFQQKQTGTMETLMQFLRNEAASLLSFDVSRELARTDSVVFYFVNGQYLLPASIILACIKETEEQEKRILGNVLIRGSATQRGSNSNDGENPVDGGLTDAEFHAHAGGNLIHGESMRKSFNSPFKYYWQYDSSTGRYTEPTDNNEKEFNKMISQNLSIKTSFNYKKILGTELSKWSMI